jgi:hypothetical protein
LVYFVGIWYIFPVLVCLDQEKSGNPAWQRHRTNAIFTGPFYERERPFLGAAAFNGILSSICIRGPLTSGDLSPTDSTDFPADRSPRLNLTTADSFKRQCPLSSEESLLLPSGRCLRPVFNNMVCPMGEIHP